MTVKLIYHPLSIGLHTYIKVIITFTIYDFILTTQVPFTCMKNTINTDMHTLKHYEEPYATAIQ